MLMRNKILLILCSLSLVLTLDPTLTKNYFFVPKDNHLSYELFQTNNGIVAHTIDSASQYILIDLPSRDAKPILYDTVNACETSSPIFQRLHHHVPTDSLVYFCEKNSSLLLINQSNDTVQSLLSFNIQCPVTRLSTDGMNVAILCLNKLFTSDPQDSALIQVDIQARKVTNQILFNKDLADGEFVVAYDAGAKSHSIATNRIQDKDTLITTVYSLVVIGNNYQLTKLAAFSVSLTPSTQVITKLFSLGNFLAVNNGQDLLFLNQQGTVVSENQAKLKVINGLSHPAVTSRYDNPNLFVHTSFGLIEQYFIVAGTLQSKQSSDSYVDLQVAYGNAKSGDLTFALGFSNVFTVTDVKSSKIIYSAISGYDDLMLTDTTYAVIRQDYSSQYQLYLFDLKTDELLIQVALGKTNNLYYNKDQQMISYLKTSMASGSACTLTHIDLVSVRVWSTMDFDDSPYSICESSIAYARITQNKKPEVILPLKDFYLIVSEKYGQLTFKTTSVDFTSLNLNFDDLSAYYLVSDQAKNQVTASFYTFDPQSKDFQLQKTHLFESVPVNKKGFFTVNSEMTVAISSNTFFVIDKLDSPVSRTFPNNFNLATSFQDANKNEYVLVAYYDAVTPKGSVPQLFATIGDFVPLPGSRMNSVSGRATGARSFALHDDLNQSVGLVRFYNANVSKGAKGFLTISA